MKSLTFVLSFGIVTMLVLPGVAAVSAGPDQKAQSESGPRPSLLPLAPTIALPGSLDTPSKDIRVTNTSRNQNEIGVAINPLNSANIVMGANDYRGWDNGGRGSWCGVYATVDGGAHWTLDLIPKTGALGWSEHGGDPSLAFDLSGNVYYVCLGFVPLSVPPYIINNTIAVSKSTDGGFTWLPPVDVVSVAAAPPFHDKPYIGIDTSLFSPHKGNIYVSWTNFSSLTGAGVSPIYFSRSTNGGANFSIPIKISGTQSYCQGSQPSVGPGGEVYVSFLSYVGAQTRLYVVKSVDGGATFSAPVLVSNVIEPADLPEFYRTPTIPSSATDNSAGRFGGSVYVVWQDDRNGDSDVYLSYSRDGGASWSTPSRVNNDVGRTAQFFPFVSVSPNGRVDVVFYDRRRDTQDILFDVYAAYSHDGGASFWNRRISDKQMDPGGGRPFIGDYIGVDSLNDRFFPGWCGFVGSDEEVFMEITMVPFMPLRLF